MTDQPAHGRVHAALLTAEAPGAIAVVRVWGAGALNAASRVFRSASGKPLQTARPGQIRFGHVGPGVGDEVVAMVFPGETEPEVEFHGHGGMAAVAMLLETLEAAGVEIADCAAWLAWMGGSRVSVEAHIDLAHAETVRVAEILLDQAQGAFDCEIEDVLIKLHEDVQRAKAALKAMLRRAPVGVRLRSGWIVALAGRPNVGKSRLLNALAGFERAIVSPVAGTTRDVLTLRTAFDGWPVELADTAGVRPTLDPLEATGVEMARDRHETADLVVLVLDRSEPLSETDRELIAEYENAMIVANKCDLPAAWTYEHLGIVRPIHEVSAETGAGIGELTHRMAERLVPEPPSPGAAVPFREAQVMAMEEACRWIEAGRVDEAERALRSWIQPAGSPTVGSEFRAS